MNHSLASDRSQTRHSPRSLQAAAPFHVMTKPSGSRCNLDCHYCFYLEKEKLYPRGPNDVMRMSTDLLETYVRDYIAAQPGPVVSFAWQGGEPTLLGADFFREAVALQKRHANGKQIENAFQTNGTLLNDEWGQFLAKEKFLVGISIDGPRALHDAYRVDRGQRPTFDRVMAGLEVLKKHKIEFNTLTTVHRKNAPQALEVYRFLRKHGSGFMQFIPIVERMPERGSVAHGLELSPPPELDHTDKADARVTPWSVRPAEFGAFLCTIFDEWVQRDVGRVFVQHFDTALAKWVGVPGGSCVFAETCGRGLAIEHNGDVYSCDHYVYPEYRLGNIRNTPLAELVDSPRQQKFGTDKSSTLPKYCRECPVKFACNGDCPKHRFGHTPDGEPGLSYLCKSYRRFFSHIDPSMKTMAALLQNGRAPAEIMTMPRPKGAGSHVR
jgi:uncharacterized protein